ncbi:unnamed protein product, partial [marine sediment metagenome]
EAEAHRVDLYTTYAHVVGGVTEIEHREHTGLT